MNAKTSNTSIQNLTIGAILTALVIVLQLAGSFIRFGTFSVSLVLIPIVVGAATCGPYIGAWLGLIFGVAVFMSGDAAAFMAFSVPGTIITVLLKGILCGLAAGLVYRLLAKQNVWLGVIAAAVVCPIVNTGVFLLGCLVFFMDAVTSWAPAGQSAVAYMFLGLVGANFLFEFGFNLVLSPIVVRLLHIVKKLN